MPERKMELEKPRRDVVRRTIALSIVVEEMMCRRRAFVNGFLCVYARAVLVQSQVIIGSTDLYSDAD